MGRVLPRSAKLLTGTHKWPTVAVPAAAGLLVVLLAWLAGPGIFGISSSDQGVPTQAQVVKPASCDTPNASETVKFTLGGKQREGTLNGCGHGQGEHVQVGIPVDAPETGPVTVRAADTSAGAQDARRPIGLALLVFAGAAGAIYVYLVLRNVPKPKPNPAS
ncbi:MAG TPA: hypothetical protein VJX66_18105 [Amycolatopsis sp.]|nr:hypothetical protein [Amycolatopsis sp.]